MTEYVPFVSPDGLNSHGTGKEHIHYSHELMEQICEMIAAGAWMSEIETLPGMPSQHTLWNWRAARPDVADKYENAVMRRCETMQDHHRKMVRDCPLNIASIRLLEVALKSDMWYMERLFPKKYGARTVISGDKDNPIEMNLAKSLDAKIAEARAKPRTIEHQPMKMPVVDVESSE